MPNSQVLDRIVLKPEESLRKDVADIFCDSLGEHLVWPILPPDRASVWELIMSSLRLADVYAGLDASGSLLGFAFVTDKCREPFCLEDGWMCRTWGAWGAIWRRTMFNIAHFGQNRRRALRLEAFVVRPEFRGKGVGTQLMSRILADARASGHRFVTIDVDDENSHARRLYEDLGFRITRTLWVPSRQSGMRNVVVMRLDL